MARDYFAVLGLAPGRYDPQEIARRFIARRDRLLVRMLAEEDSRGCRRDLDELHLAYATLRDPRQQREYRQTLEHTGDDRDRVAALRGFITASLEDGLLRYSRRQAILDKARALGFDDFQAQLMIAQVQFGDEQIPALNEGHAEPGRWVSAPPRVWARVAATGVLALAIFLYLVRWVNGG